jgi:hypothetical protein
MAVTETEPANPIMPEDERALENSPAVVAETDPIVGRRVSHITNVHDAGSDANDTPDGLTESEEAVRHAAEDIPTGQSPMGPTDQVPVFDRGSLPPKV